jgi:hypothetical protein
LSSTPTSTTARSCCIWNGSGTRKILDVVVTLAGIQVTDFTKATAPGTEQTLRDGHLADLAQADPAAFVKMLQHLWPVRGSEPEHGRTAHAVAEAWDAADEQTRAGGYWLAGPGWYRRLRRLAGDTTDEDTWIPSADDLFLARPVRVDGTSRSLLLLPGPAPA